ncbi:MAG: acyl-CoA dehydratase activase [Firmicutes bacterium]|nr:acyl-CoA dehydratase activase [Bacillota bacterium]
MLFAGIDVGSATAKAVVLRKTTAPSPGPTVLPGLGHALELTGWAILPTGYDMAAAGERALEEALGRARARAEAKGDFPPPERVVATGYGRSALRADRAVTEITCHARGASVLVPGVGTVVDVGGQDSKGIAVGPGGRVLDFVMNDKCAAGTGRFLEVMARALEVPLEEFGLAALRAERAAPITNICTVFAESEVVSLRASRRPREEIAAGIHQAMARRIAGMARRLDLRPPVVMTGGVARNVGLVRALETELGLPVIVPELAQLAGALGAAVLAAQVEEEPG